METYTEKLYQIGIILLEPLKQVKLHHHMQCIACQYQWKATPISKLQNYKKTGMIGCPQCTGNQKYESQRNQNLQTLKDRGFIVHTKYDGRRGNSRNSITIHIDVTNTNCGHRFETDTKNLLSKNVNCPICNKQTKISRLNNNSKARSVEWQKTADEWDRYRHQVYMATRSTYRKHKIIINPLDLPRGKAGQEGAYHLDHIVPVRYCFKHQIPVDVCSHYTNLQMLKWNDNIGSKDKLKEGIDIPSILKPYIKIAT